MDLPMCRLCLTPNSGTAALFDDRTMKPNVLLLQKVVECTSIKLTTEEDYPSSICAECVKKLNEWSTFKIQCIVNNDFYRKKQSDLRKQMISNQQPTEVVCLDDDEDEEENQGAPSPKKAKIVEQVVIDVDDDEEQEEEEEEQVNGQVTVGALGNSATIYYEGNGEQVDEEENISLDDYELVEGQEVDQYLPEQNYQDYQIQGNIDNSAILSSILLDDDSNSFEGDFTTGYFRGEFQCTVCDRVYGSASQLRAHMKCHTENKKKCFICGKMIVVHLIRHLRSQHRGQAFPEPVRCWHTKCAHINEVFCDVDQLLAHMDAKRRY